MFKTWKVFFNFQIGPGDSLTVVLSSWRTLSERNTGSFAIRLVTLHYEKYSLIKISCGIFNAILPYRKDCIQHMYSFRIFVLVRLLEVIFWYNKYLLMSKCVFIWDFIKNHKGTRNLNKEIEKWNSLLLFGLWENFKQDFEETVI